MSTQEARAVAAHAAATYLNGDPVATIEDLVYAADIIVAYIEGGVDGARRVGQEQRVERGLDGPPPPNGRTLDPTRVEEVVHQVRVGASELLTTQLRRLDGRGGKGLRPAKPRSGGVKAVVTTGVDPAAQKLADEVGSCKSRGHVERLLSQAKATGVLYSSIWWDGKRVSLRERLREAWNALPESGAPNRMAGRTSGTRTDLGL